MTPHDIIEATADHFGIQTSDLTGQSRKQEFAAARHTAAWLIRQTHPLSLTEIGRLFGRDHTSILYGIRRMEFLTEHGDPIGNSATVLRDRLAGRVAQLRHRNTWSPWTALRMRRMKRAPLPIA